MSSKTQKLTVATVAEMEQALTGYLAQGFTIVNKTPTSTTLQKKKEFSALWAVIGFLFCVLPLVIYLIVYSSKPDVEIVEIVVVPV